MASALDEESKSSDLDIEDITSQPDRMGDSPQKRKRARPLSEEQIGILIHEFGKRRSEIENSHRNAQANVRKNKAWQEITDVVNAVDPDTKRTSAQIQEKWKNYKKTVKGKHAEEKKLVLKTGAAPDPSKLMTPVEVQVNEMYQGSHSWDGVPGGKESKIGTAKNSLVVERKSNSDSEITSQERSPVELPPKIRKIVVRKPVSDRPLVSAHQRNPSGPKAPPRAASTSGFRPCTAAAASALPSTSSATETRPSSSSGLHMASFPRKPADPSTISILQVEALRSQITSNEETIRMCRKVSDFIDEARDVLGDVKRLITANGGAPSPEDTN